MPWTNSEQETVLRQLAMAAEVLGEAVTPARILSYCALLDDLPAACVACGIEESIKTLRWFPKPVDIRELGLASAKWRRRLEAQKKPERPALPEMSHEEMQANIARLKAAVAKLSGPRRLR